MRLRDLVLVALFAGLMAVLAQISIAVPLLPVPITLQVVGLMLTATLLGGRLSALAMVVYVLLGLIGAPVYAGGHSGLSVLLGHTGGYLLSYPFAALLTGWLVQRRPTLGYGGALLATVAGMVIVYALGTLQLGLVLHLPLLKALWAGTGFFLAFDAIKLLAVAAIAVPVRSQLIRAGLVPAIAAHRG